MGPLFFLRCPPYPCMGPLLLPRCCRSTCIGPSLLPKILLVVLDGPAVCSEMLPVYCTCIGPLLLAKNTTDGNAWARCSSRDAAEALIWAHRCCRMNPLMDTKRPTTSPGRCCRYPRMGPSFLPKILLMVLLLSLRCSQYPCMSLLLLPKIPPMAMNGPTVRPEMLLKHLHRLILLPKELLMVMKRSNNSSERCC